MSNDLIKFDASDIINAEKTQTFNIGHATSGTAQGAEEQQEAWVYLRKGDNDIAGMPQKQFIDVFLSHFEEAHENVRRTLGRAIEYLLKNRDFLGLQLDLAYKNISEEDFNRIADEDGHFFPTIRYDDQDLLECVNILLTSIQVSVDSEVISTLFNCSIEQAENALFAVIRQQQEFSK